MTTINTHLAKNLCVYVEDRNNAYVEDNLIQEADSNASPSDVATEMSAYECIPFE